MTLSHFKNINGYDSDSDKLNGSTNANTILYIKYICKVGHLNFQPSEVVIADKVLSKLYNKYIIKRRQKNEMILE